MARAVAALPRVRLRGLMAIPEPAGDLAAQRAPHRALRELLVQPGRRRAGPGHAVDGHERRPGGRRAEGATMVRVGTADLRRAGPAGLNRSSARVPVVERPHGQVQHQRRRADGHRLAAEARARHRWRGQPGGLRTAVEAALRRAEEPVPPSPPLSKGRLGGFGGYFPINAP